MSVTVLNTTASLSGKTLLKAEDSQTITGAKTFDLGAAAPFVVVSGAAKVTNLDADKLDGLSSAEFAILANAAAFASTVSVAGTVSPLGLVDASGAAAGQVKFPATQNPSTNANTLDDYEEGPWMPTLTGSGGGSGQTYTTQVGKYIKVGKKVTATFQVRLSAVGTITTDAQIAGLPFTIENTTNGEPSLQIGFWTAMTATFVYIGGLGNVNTTLVTIYGAKVAATGLTALVQADFSATSAIYGELTYMASA